MSRSPRRRTTRLPNKSGSVKNFEGGNAEGVEQKELETNLTGQKSVKFEDVQNEKSR